MTPTEASQMHDPVEIEKNSLSSRLEIKSESVELKEYLRKVISQIGLRLYILSMKLREPIQSRTY